MVYNNFSVSKSKAQFYLKEKQPTEGYVEVIYGPNKDKKTYHKYFKSVQGIPSGFGQKDVEYDGGMLRFLELELKDGETVNKISVPLKNRGGYTEEARQLISMMSDADITKEIRVTAATRKYTNSKGQEKTSFNFYGNYTGTAGENGKELSTGFIAFDSIPKPEVKTVAGDITYDFTPQTEFFYSKMKEIEGKFGVVTPTPAPEKAKKEPKSKALPTPVAEEVFDDDLPF